MKVVVTFDGVPELEGRTDRELADLAIELWYRRVGGVTIESIKVMDKSYNFSRTEQEEE